MYLSHDPTHPEQLEENIQYLYSAKAMCVFDTF